MPAGVLPNYSGSVTRNGSAVDFVSFSFRRNTGELFPQWSIRLASPIVVEEADTWTITRGIGGYTRTLADEELAENIDGEYGSIASAEVSGRSYNSSGAKQLLEYVLPVDLVFISPSWKADTFPDATLIGGILQNVSYAGGETSSSRCYHPRLPGRDTEDDDFTCVYARTHLDVAQWIATQAGFRVECNTPEVELIDTQRYAAGTRLWDVIARNSKIWQATPEIVNDRIYILDSLASSYGVSCSQSVTLANRAIRDVRASNKTGGRLGADNEVDHLIVTGRARKNSVIAFPRSIDETQVTPEIVELTADETRTRLIQVSTLPGRKILEEYTGSWGDGDDAFTPLHLSKIIRIDKNFIDPRTERRVLLEKRLDSYLSDGSLQSRTTITHKYDKDYRLVRTTEKLEGLIKLPKKSNLYWKTIRNKITEQVAYIKALNLSLTKELVEELVLYEEGSSGSKLDPIPLYDFQRADKSRTGIDTSKTSTQEVLEMTTHYRWTDLEREDEKTLVQTAYDYDVLSGTTRITSHTVRDPKDLEEAQKEIPFSKEYHPPWDSGQTIGLLGTCYHSPQTISHEDLDTEVLLDAVAERFWARVAEGGSSEADTFQINLAVPIPFTGLDAKITIPDHSYIVNNQTVSVSGGEYILRGIDEETTYQKGRDSSQVNLAVKQTLTVRKKP